MRPCDAVGTQRLCWYSYIIKKLFLIANGHAQWLFQIPPWVDNGTATTYSLAIYGGAYTCL